MGSCPTPTMVAKFFLPKYSPRIDNSTGILPPNPIPKITAKANTPIVRQKEIGVF